MKRFLLSFFTFILLIGCSENELNPEKNPYHQNEEVAEKVIVILDENSDVTSTTSELENGMYVIEFTNETPAISENDIIVGSEGEGFLRKVISVNTKNNTVTLQTSQANLDDVFNNANIEFTTDISGNTKSGNINNKIKVNYLHKGVKLAADGLTYDFSNTILYKEPHLTFSIDKGSATFNPNFNFKADYTLLGGLDYLNFETNNTSLNIDCDLAFTVSGGVSLPEFSQTLVDFDKNITFLVAGVPVIITVNTQLVAELSASVDANITSTYS